MNDYEKLSLDFLDKCKANIVISFVGKRKNENWNDSRERNLYNVRITTPLGYMKVSFWDSIFNTENNRSPTAYDILSVLTKYEVGTIDDFVSEYGLTVREWDDVRKIERMYKLVVREYQDLRRCFTSEQIDALREIE